MECVASIGASHHSEADIQPPGEQISQIVEIPLNYQTVRKPSELLARASTIGRELFQSNRYKVHHGSINSIQLKNNLLISGSGVSIYITRLCVKYHIKDTTIKIWDIMKLNHIKTLEGHSDGITLIFD
jgi:WD40 repeat protein